MGDMGFTVFKEWEDQGQTVIMNNLVVGSIRTVSLGGASKTQTSKVTIKNNNVFVDSGVFGQVFSCDKSEPRLKNLMLTTIIIIVMAGQEQNTQQACVFSRIQRAIGDWHTHLKNYIVLHHHGRPQSIGLIQSMVIMKSHGRCVFEDGTFSVTTELVDRRNRRVTSDCN